MINLTESILLLKKSLSNENNDDINDIAAFISSCSSQGGTTTPHSKQFSTKYSITIREQDFNTCSMGWQTWDSAALFTHLMDTQQIIIDSPNILELGSGTGLAGLYTALSYPKSTVYLSDYLDSILENTLFNLNTNHIKNAFICKLDWKDPTNLYLFPQNVRVSLKFNTIIATDVVYDEESIPLLCQTLSHYLELGGVAYFVIPLRRGFNKEIILFEKLNGFVKLESREIEFNHQMFMFYIFLNKNGMK